MIAHEPANAKVEQFQKATEELSAYIHQAAEKGFAAHQVEEDILRKVLQMGRLAMERFLAFQGDGDLGEQVELPDGRQLKRLEDLHTRSYLSIFGLFEIPRAVYGTREGQAIEFVPLDTRLSLPESKFSYLLQDWDQMIGSEQPFKQVSQFLQRIFGLKQHVDSLERMSRKLTDDADSFCWSHETPPEAEEGEILVQTADGKGVPMRRPAKTPPIQNHQRKPGPKRDRKKMATLGVVYTVNRYVRTPDDVAKALFHEHRPEERPPRRPRPCHKYAYGRLTSEEPDGEIVDSQIVVFAWIEEQVRRRDRLGKKERVCLMDGQETLWDTKNAVQGDQPMTEILDLLHVTPRLWKAAHIFEGSRSKRALSFVREYVLKILRGQVRAVTRGLRRMATTRRLSMRKQEKIETICQYFDNHRHRMRYHQYLKKGYPIASGVIEGACRHIVKDRMEGTGMSWSKPGALAMLLQRAIYTSGQWDDFIRYRIQRETERIHPYRSVVQECHWALAA